MNTYYVDPVLGDDLNDGLSPEKPMKDHRRLNPQPGDTVLFRCGSVYRGQLSIAGGAEGAATMNGAS